MLKVIEEEELWMRTVQMGMIQVKTLLQSKLWITIGS